MDNIRTILFFVILVLAQYSLGVEGDTHDCKSCQGTVGSFVHGSTGNWLKAEVLHRDWAKA
ncbi:MAG: hypothetical protein K2Y18_06455 [Alphaproteobacteria bacterium]|jgi:hypothetical protein|nr:hypothetical protein [Alphaproteobacteria bacterium]